MFPLSISKGVLSGHVINMKVIKEIVHILLMLCDVLKIWYLVPT